MSHNAFTGLVDLASAALGGQALLCSDDFFAEMSNLLLTSEPVFKPDLFTPNGKWMDGWESRRRRVPGHDWCILALGVPGQISGVDIDTAHFMGNHPPYASLDACHAPPGTTPEQLRDEVQWTQILEQSPLQRGSHNYFGVPKGKTWTHLRLNIYPDGGVARIRAYGTPAAKAVAGSTDLASALNGGRVSACSDMFFGDANNLLLPHRAETMGGGWESRRRRGDGHDWTVVELGVPGVVDQIELDTNHFKGNFPDRCSIEGIYWPKAPVVGLLASPDWVEIMPQTRMVEHAQRTFDIPADQPLTHIRLNVFPCGGVSRMRVHGNPVEQDFSEEGLAKLNALSPSQLHAHFMRCCGATRWAMSMTQAAPFASMAELQGAAADLWWHLDETDWREAFTHHPQIGGDVAELRKKFAATASLSENEQAGVAGAHEDTLTALAAENTTYLERFGYIFIICATGKTASEMLEALRARKDNAPEYELRIAAGEQAKITRIRLEKLL